MWPQVQQARARAYRRMRTEVAICVGEARTSLDLARSAVAELEELTARALFGSVAGWLR